MCDPTNCGCNFSLFQPMVFNLYLRCWERSDGYLGLPDNLLIVASFGCSPKNIDRLFPSFHDFLMATAICTASDTSLLMTQWFIPR
ncbi:hypothetical protein [Bacteroides caecimuris]|uniref:hypothetical protein n=1 Tax=Bacteroides caecimuris TaxID=1796613 RepID=UPI0026603ABD|nr:hypothetical protein [Bacteroides caecimuris]